MLERFYKNMTKNTGEFRALALLSVLYIVAIFRFQTVPVYVLVSTAIFAICYFVWGIAHHLKAKNFHVRIVLEYLLVAILGVAIVSTLLL